MSSSGLEPAPRLRFAQLPQVAENPNGWGPPETPTEFLDMPFQPFSKTDRLGRVSDWAASGRFQQGRRPQAYGAATAGASAFSYVHEDEGAFEEVDNSTPAKPTDGRRKFTKFSHSNMRTRGRGNIRNWGRTMPRGGGVGGRAGVKQAKHQQRLQRRKWAQGGAIEEKLPSCQKKDTWIEKDVIGFDELNNKTAAVRPGEDILDCGELFEYNAKFDRITPRTEVVLQKYDRSSVTATTSADPFLMSEIEKKTTENAGAGKSNGFTVYGTDTIFGALMALPRSVSSFDVVCYKKDGVIYFDKREGDDKLDLLTVNENSGDMFDLDEDADLEAIREEATRVNLNFAQQVLLTQSAPSASAAAAPIKPVKLAHENPFLDALAHGQQLYSTAPIYRRFAVTDDITLVSRTTVNCIHRKRNANSQEVATRVAVRALLESDSAFANSTNWRSQLEQQQGAVFASEAKNNANRLTRWLAEIELSGAEEVRMGFVSRAVVKSARDATPPHAILSVVRYNLESFATALNYKRARLWGTLIVLLQRIMKQEDGVYLLLKDPNFPKLYLYLTDGDIPAEEIANGADEEDE